MNDSLQGTRDKIASLATVCHIGSGRQGPIFAVDQSSGVHAVAGRRRRGCTSQGGGSVRGQRIGLSFGGTHCGSRQSVLVRPPWFSEPAGEFVQELEHIRRGIRRICPRGEFDAPTAIQDANFLSSLSVISRRRSLP